MSNPEGDISIGINIELVGKSSKTVDTLNDLNRTLQALQKFSVRATAGFTGVSAGMVNIGDTVVRSSDILEGFLTRMGELDIDLDKVGKSATQVRKAISVYNTSLSAGRMIMDMFGRSLTQVAWDPTEEGLRNISTELETFRVNGKLGVDVVNQMAKAFGRAGVRIPVDKIREMDTALEGNSEQLVKWAVNFSQSTDIVTERLRAVSDMNRTVTATFGPMGVAIMDAANTFFWFGLGSMFTVMSLMRLSRAVLTIKSSNLSLVRANIRLLETQQELNRYQMAGIFTGRAYARVAIGVREATLAQELAEDRLKQAIQNRIFSYMQLAFGTLPTIIRASTDIFRISLMLAVAKNTETNATWQQVIATKILSAEQLAQANVQELVNAALIRTIVLTAGATFGLTALTAAVGMFISKAAITRQLADVNTEFEEMRKLIVEPGSPPLFESFRIMGKNIDYLTRRMKNLQEVTNVAAGLRGMSSNQAPVYVSVTGPFYIRDRSDIDHLGNVLVSKIRSRGASVL